MKRQIRMLCDYTLAGLNKHVPLVLARVNKNISLIRKYERLSARYASAYRHGVTGRLAVFMTKKFRGHRCLPAGWEKDMAEYYEKYGRDEKTGQEKEKSDEKSEEEAAVEPPKKKRKPVRRDMYKKT